jgi:hypothetical protein
MMNETDACWLTVEEAMKRYSIRSRRTLQNWQNSENLGFPRPVKYLNRCYYLRMFMKVATVFMNAATAEQSCKALRLRLSGTPPRGAVYPTGV